MKLSVGIVGLPNVGKSTLFNAITNASVDAKNYPFCTIEPNSGVVAIPDERLGVLSSISGSSKLIYATIEFVDIAGLVKGASKGEGLGNQFLANIRETSVIAHVVRCFEDDNVIHVHGKIDPIDDIDTINTELILADLDMVDKLIQNQIRKAKAQPKEEKEKLVIFERIKAHLEQGKPVRSIGLSDDEFLLLKGVFFLSQKRVVYVANVSESDVVSENDWVKKVREHVSKDGDAVITVCAQMEAELSQLGDDDKVLYLNELGLKESGLDKLAKAAFQLLNAQTYLTTGEKETRAWVIPVGATAPEAAGVIHTDFQKGFIRANIVSYGDFVKCNGLKEAREKGLLRQEGKEYIMQDGDVVEFLFNV